MTVIVGYLPTPEGKAALAAAVEEAAARSTRLLVMNSSRGEGYADDHLASQDDLARIDRLVAEGGVEHEIVQQVRGRDASEEIIELAESTQAELVVIGLRRRSPVGKLLLGSTAQRILLGVDCRVLAVKA